MNDSKFYLFVVALFFLIGCKHEPVSPAGPGGPGDPGDPGQDSVCYDDIQALFNRSCAMSGCHDVAQNGESLGFVSVLVNFYSVSVSLTRKVFEFYSVQSQNNNVRK